MHEGATQLNREQPARCKLGYKRPILSFSEAAPFFSPHLLIAAYDPRSAFGKEVPPS